MKELVLTVDQLPEIEDWQIGEEYKIVLEVKQIKKRGQKATFEILSARSVPQRSPQEEVPEEPEEQMSEEELTPTRKKVINRLSERSQEY